MIPPLTATGALPCGRYRCDLVDLKARFVLDPIYSASSKRAQQFADLLQVKAMLDSIDPALVEVGWVGGSFTTDVLDPDDIDCLFVVNGDAFDALPSNSARARVMQFNKPGRIRTKTGLLVDTFVMVRVPVALPWQSGGIDPTYSHYFGLRGAWDDWWLRPTTRGNKGATPTVVGAHPVRGYLEVTW